MHFRDIRRFVPQWCGSKLHGDSNASGDEGERSTNNGFKAMADVLDSCLNGPRSNNHKYVDILK